jgi:rod shape determining protein RodA
MKRQINIVQSIDWLAVVLYLVLVTFGWLNIFAVNFSSADGSFFQLTHRYTMQLAWIGISLVVVLVIFVLDSRFYSFVAYPVYGFAMFLLIVVLLVGTEVHSSKSWIVFGPVSLQPSEFAKAATLLALARFLSGYNIKISRMRDVFITLGIVFLPAALIMLQPDFGSTIVYGIILLVLYREGLPSWVLILAVSMIALFLGTLLIPQFVIFSILLSLFVVAVTIYNRKPMILLVGMVVVAIAIATGRLLAHLAYIPAEKFNYLLIALGLTIVVTLIFNFKAKIREVYMLLGFLVLAIAFIYSVDFVFHHVMQEHQQNRVNVMLGLESDPYGYEYNVRQSKIAIGSGGFSGKGFLQGTQTKFRFVPEQSTDFIFCTVGEEWGFLGSFGLVLVYVGLLIRLIFLAERQRSSFNRIYGYGVVSVLFFHFAVNIGMTIGLFPVIGIPLPFLSYGGSSLLAFTIMLFIFIKLDSSRRTYLV